MTLKQIEQDYEVVDEVIRSPGKFEGEMVYAPYLYQIWLEDGCPEGWIPLMETDSYLFPQLANKTGYKVVTDDNGFVYVLVK